MTNKNIQTLKGFRDILPVDARKRQWVRDSMIKTAEKWGYEPIETPTLEPFELFEGEIGEDEKLFYKFTDNGGREVIMRYDQTVPTCRYVATNFAELTLPFRRYQIQSVFRAEKPQKGRYREFTQFDLDIFGVKGAEADAEVIAENLETYVNLGFKKPVIIFNSRELMKGIPYEAIVAIDKLKKIGRDGVIENMIKKGIAKTQAETYFQQVIDIKPDETIKTIINYLENSGFSNEFYRFEPTLARSFSYSEGPIWEIVIEDYKVGSVGGGERYDSMMKRLTNLDVPATGIAFGFDRTVEAADLLGLIPQINLSQVLITTFNKKYQKQTLEIAKKLRQAEVKTELYPDITDKIGKQFKYADKKKIPYAIVIGEEEVAQNKVSLKNLQTRDQEMLSMEEVINKLR
ncbi:histidine--tRNA ligase [Patescibacteria group bacterium]|nr:histidine--tRNA ligase [Patescibacteria group bacterium]